MGDIGKEEFRVNMTRCLSDLDHWIDANEQSYDPVMKEKSDKLQSHIYVAERALKYLLKTSINNVENLTREEIHSLRFCVSSWMTITTDDKQYKRLQDCLTHIRKILSSGISV